MSRVDNLRVQHEIELNVVGLEEELVALKASGKKPDRLRAVKDELRAWRCVLRLGRPEFAVVIDHETGEPVLDEQGEPVRVQVHNGYNIVDGQLVEKEG